MRSFLVLALALAMGLSICAQPTINVSDLPQGGTVYLRANGLPPLNADEINLAGSDVTWNFSDLLFQGDAQTEYSPMSAASLTTQFVFSSADHFTAFELPDFGADLPIPISGATVYREYGNNAYRTIGVGITTDLFDLPVNFTDEEELLPLPLTYGATLDASSAFALDLEGLFYYATDQVMDIEVDAWGTLLLPGGAYNCLRVKRDFSALDTIGVAAADIGFTIPREGTVYEWYAPGEGMPVLSVQTFVDIPAIWQFKYSETDGVESAAAPEDWKMGPSPVREGQRLGCPGLSGHDVLVTDATGRECFRGQPDGAGPQTGLSTAGWGTGIVLVTDLVSGQSTRVVIH